MEYCFEFEEKAYVLKSDACSFFLNDEEVPLEGMDIDGILKEMLQSDMVSFQREYYDQACENCHKNRREGARYFEFLEYHFYLFAKDQKYVMSSLSAEYENKTLPDLLDEGVVDSSYIVSVNVCPECGNYTIDMEYGLW